MGNMEKAIGHCEHPTRPRAGYFEKKQQMRSLGGTKCRSNPLSSDCRGAQGGASSLELLATTLN